MGRGHSASFAVACLGAIGVLAVLVAGGRMFAAALRGAWLGSLDVDIKRWLSTVPVPLAVQLWANRTGGATCARFDGRDVIVVGNAPTVRFLGSAIDAFDVVVRVNPTTAERSAQHASEHRGRRASAVHVNVNHPAARLQAIFGRFLPPCVWTRSRADTAVQLGLRYTDARISEYDDQRMVDAFPELRACGPTHEKFLTAGMLAVLHALGLGARRPLRVAGITAFVAAGHAVTNYSAFHDANLARYHCVGVERRLLRRLVREGAVALVDDAAAALFAPAAPGRRQQQHVRHVQPKQQQQQMQQQQQQQRRRARLRRSRVFRSESEQRE